MVENHISASQYATLQSPKGRFILLCWTVRELDLRKGYGHIQPNSGTCRIARYYAGVQPSTLSAEDMEKLEGSLLAIACSTCPIMAQAIAALQTT